MRADQLLLTHFYSRFAPEKFALKLMNKGGKVSTKGTFRMPLYGMLIVSIVWNVLLLLM